MRILILIIAGGRLHPVTFIYSTSKNKKIDLEHIIELILAPP